MIPELLDYPEVADADLINRILGLLTTPGEVSEDRAVLLMEYLKEKGSVGITRMDHKANSSTLFDGSGGGHSNDEHLDEMSKILKQYDHLVLRQQLAVRVVGVYHTTPYATVKTTAMSAATSLAIETISDMLDFGFDCSSIIETTNDHPNFDGVHTRQAATSSSTSSPMTEIQELIQLTMSDEEVFVSSMASAPWMRELIGVLLAHTSFEIHGASRLSYVAPCVLNETALFCLRELELVLPGLCTMNSDIDDELSAMRKRWNLMAHSTPTPTSPTTGLGESETQVAVGDAAANLYGIAALVDTTARVNEVIATCYQAPTGKNPDKNKSGKPRVATPTTIGGTHSNSHPLPKNAVFKEVLGSVRKMKRIKDPDSSAPSSAISTPTMSSLPPPKRNVSGTNLSPTRASSSSSLMAMTSHEVGELSPDDLRQQMKATFEVCVDAIRSAVYRCGSLPSSLLADIMMWMLAIYGCEKMKFASSGLHEVLSTTLCVDAVQQGETLVVSVDHFMRVHAAILLQSVVSLSTAGSNVSHPGGLDSALPPSGASVTNGMVNFIPASSNVASSPTSPTAAGGGGGSASRRSVRMGGGAQQQVMYKDRPGFYFANGPKGLGYYRLDARDHHLQCAARSTLRTLYCFVDSNVYKSAQKAALLSMLLIPSDITAQGLLARLEGPGRAWENTTTMVLRLLTAALSSKRHGLSKAISCLRYLRESVWSVPAMRATVVIACTALVLKVPDARQACASMLSSCSPHAVGATVDAVYQHDLRAQEARRDQRSKEHQARVQPTSSEGDSVAASSTTKQQPDKRGGDTDQQLPTTATQPQKQVSGEFLELMATTIVVNHTPLQLVRSFPTLLRAFDTPSVPNKQLILQHLMARIPELDNTWYVGNALLMCLRAFVVQEAHRITHVPEQTFSASPPAGASSSATTQEATLTAQLVSLTRAFLETTDKQFSDPAISQHVHLMASTLNHLTLNELAFLMDVTRTDAEDVMKFCERKGGAAIAVAPQAPLDIVLKPLAKPFYLQTSAAANLTASGVKSSEVELSFVVRIVTDDAQDNGDNANEQIDDGHGVGQLVGGSIRVYTSNEHRDDEHLVLSQPIPYLNEGSYEQLTIDTKLRLFSCEPQKLFVTCLTPQHAPLHLEEPLMVGFERLLRREAVNDSTAQLVLNSILVPQQVVATQEEEEEVGHHSNCTDNVSQQHLQHTSQRRLSKKEHDAILSAIEFDHQLLEDVSALISARVQEETQTDSTEGCGVPQFQRSSFLPSWVVDEDGVPLIRDVSLFNVTPSGRVMVLLLDDAVDLCDDNSSSDDEDSGASSSSSTTLWVGANTWKVQSLVDQLLSEICDSSC